ncbi:hypothetical protein [Streptomyces sp. NPDC008121]|uniref:hypothetical protein n=1 Tax=Streptomyces sp. NPDC008121 TaxID=3364809 RepID=UPI0036EDDCEA
MTRTLPPAPRPAAARPGTTRGARPGTARRVLRTFAAVAGLPYIALKIAWVAGSEIGIPAGSPLLDHRTLLIVANTVSVVADALVVVLARLLTEPWGLRVRAWLLAFPLWVATGLLAPIMVAFPAQLVTALFTGPGNRTADGGPARPFLDEWVFGVVYGGFIVQGAALGALFFLYARDRWGHLWRGTLGELPARSTGAPVRIAAVTAAVLAVASAAPHVRWALGSTAGLSAARMAQRTSDVAVLEWTRVLFAAVAVGAVLLLVSRRPRGLPVLAVLGPGWVATGGLGCWGAYLSLVSLMPETDQEKAHSVLMEVTYAGEMITGFLLAGCLAVFLRRRAA